MKDKAVIQENGKDGRLQTYTDLDIIQAGREEEKELNLWSTTISDATYIQSVVCERDGSDPPRAPTAGLRESDYAGILQGPLFEQGGPWCI